MISQQLQTPPREGRQQPSEERIIQENIDFMDEVEIEDQGVRFVQCDQARRSKQSATSQRAALHHVPGAIVRTSLCVLRLRIHRASSRERIIIKAGRIRKKCEERMSHLQERLRHSDQ
ncbi:hypothetical protein ANCCAN_11543 [Ancylostoma caninum]|uniref:Uncharacterized protein n=1 Tax=Ancylostoma caninum TaxID=29170 RepID=A0A368GHW6_ANCCA|nr:hypothetical protein ANCCAN_11543 [Ancylostoma caninum]